MRWTGRQFDTDMERLLDRAFGSLGRPFFWDTPDLFAAARRGWMPAVDVFTRDGDLVIRAELPGIDPENDVDITVQDGALRLRGERKHEHRTGGNGYSRFESSYGTFERTVLLPEGVETDDIRASYENGILEVVVPKVAELQQGKRIPIHVGTAHQALTTEGEKKS